MVAAGALKPGAGVARGSSCLKLPRVLQWSTGNIGFHHVHHLSACIPSYRLQECRESRPELGMVKVLTFGEALRATTYALWNEDSGRMVPFPRLLPTKRPGAAACMSLGE